MRVSSNGSCIKDHLDMYHKRTLAYVQRSWTSKYERKYQGSEEDKIWENKREHAQLVDKQVNVRGWHSKKGKTSPSR